MSKRYRALAGLVYPDGDEEYAKAVKGEPYRQVVVEAGAEAKNLPAKSLKAYLAMDRAVLAEVADE